MAEFEQPPTFPGVTYTAGKTDIGSGYAAGISQAGEGIAKGIGAALDVATRNQNATDILNGLQASKILTPDQYNAIAGKSLGAKEQMLGMFASQWVLDQANQRAIALEKGKGSVAQATQHLAFLDNMNAATGKYGTPGQIAVGVTPQKQPVTPQQPVRRAQPVTTQVVSPADQTTGGSPTPNWAQTGGTAPLPSLKSVGPPLALSERVPPGATHQQIKTKDGNIVDGILMPDGTFRPRPIQ